MIVKRENLEEHILKWQDILRLRDWDITIKMVESKWRKFGDIKIDLDDKKAVMMVNQKPYSEESYNLEELVVHELLHVKLYGMSVMIQDLLDLIYGDDDEDPKRGLAWGQYMMLLESTTEDLTKGYLAASSSDVPMSFGRLQKEIDEELGTNDAR